MVAKEIDNKICLKDQFISLLISGLIFIVIYHLCGWYASHSDKVNSFVLDFEHHIPFMAWMVVPYMSSGLLFIVIFFCCTSRNELLLLTKRINFITVISGLIFIIFPLKHTFAKPEIDSSFLCFFFQFLNTHDTVYNQAPSLHISYIFIFWSVLRHRLSVILKTVSSIWLILMGVSTLTIFQHHVIDIVTSFLLVSITFFIFPETKSRNCRVGMIYTMASVILLFSSLLIYQFISPFGLLILWISLALFMVGYAYLRSDTHFLKRKNGTIPLVKKILYLPYIFTYKAIRLFFCRNAEALVAEVFPSVFIGPMLSLIQAKRLNIDNHTIVIDLSAEVEENKFIRENTAYYSFPVLDIGTLDSDSLTLMINFLSKLYDNLKPCERIYIHCLMGYSRSAFIAAMLISNRLNISIDEAASLIRKKYPYAIFPHYLLALA